MATIPDAVKLRLYQGALRRLKQSKLSSLTEEIEARRLLDDVWDDNAINDCLENGQWNFAARTVELTNSPSITPAFGFQYAFDKPTDLIRLTALCQDEFLDYPLLRYRDDGGHWFADIEPIYVRYVSDDALYGYDTSLWTEAFINFVQVYLAFEIAPLLSVSEQILERIEKEFAQRYKRANNLNAQQQPTKFMPRGSWMESRLGNLRKYDRGTR